MKHAVPWGVLCTIILISSAQAASGDKATAEIRDRSGNMIGSIVLTETTQGVILNGTLSQLSPGPHGFHVHGVGKCEPPFTSAGGHFNPEGKKHGFYEEGAHSGDLPNLHASADGKAVVDVLAHRMVLTGTTKGLLDQDGASIVIHLKADDYKTDPAGDSGDRIACGVVIKAQ